MLNRSSEITFVNFNQTGSCISMGTSRGFKIFCSDPFGKFYSEESGSYSIVEMLFATSLLALVGSGDEPALSPRRLQIINTKKHSVICEVTFPTSILAVKMNKSRLTVLLQEQIYIYDITNMRLLHTLEIHSNVNGLMAISPTLENNYLAFPLPPRVINSEIRTNATTNNIMLSMGGKNNLSYDTTKQLEKGDSGRKDDENVYDNGSTNTINTVDEEDESASKDGVLKNGDIIIFNMDSLQPTMVIEAHRGQIASLAFNFSGTLLATASDKGTIIRVFNVETGVKLYQFRRGTYPTKIYSMCFSDDDTFLAVTSSSKTVHIFKLYKSMDITSKSGTSDEAIGADGNDYDSNFGENNEVLAMDDEGEDIDDAGASIADNDLDITNEKEPYVDASRKTVGRMIRSSSQKLSRKAVKTLGNILPIKMTSLLEPSRHFGSLKLPVDDTNDNKSIANIGHLVDVDTSNYPELFNTAENISANGQSTILKMLSIRVISSEGFLYNYILDPERGGDGLLLSQFSLLEQ
ncbi:phosphoinositide binding protein ATG18 NDAI_0H03610 [Naumovozyma dairenensis CBS 421]|uniref:Autophagy-related protein 18 n=1 Tax=Naumovozyma dairenensis (strain ATCC 10597 / BCRC 20456 / CBS 421 / NBRC 0211 / NRRL Y-12639) TaxID=1071378 RepID=G0WFH3_NAUDC|nr:hypothetical protein NDAI_0H03610 [Naumovozyma dairenensis CBS 421]CCD26534.1 hypothetical protein NDAI_0H03610 [Naumovozyma dairenensis CBS 421]